MSETPVIVDTDGIPVGFDEVYDRHFDEIFTYILRRTAHVAEAEDLTSQVFFLALRDAERRRRRRVNIPAWLYRIATNQVNDFFRSRKRSTIARSLPDDDEGLRLQDQEAVRAEEVLQRNDSFTALNAALRTLKPEDQTLIALRYFEDKSFEDIAAIVGKRVGAVTMRTHRALQKLRTELSRRGISHERFGEGHQRSVPGTYRGSDLPAKSAS